MNKNTVVSLQDREQISDPLTELVRAGARKLIEQAIDIELQELLSQYTGQQTDSGHAAVVRNGYLPERAIQTGIGPVTVKIPKVRSRSGPRSLSTLHWCRRIFARPVHWKPPSRGCISRG